jgi:hypothetical protein
MQKRPARVPVREFHQLDSRWKTKTSASERLLNLLQPGGKNAA